MDEPEPHPAYDFFTPGPLLGYAGNPNNNNGWIEIDVPLLGELGAEADESMVGPVVDEIVESIVEIEEQVIVLVIDVEEDLAILFGDDASEGFEDEEEYEFTCVHGLVQLVKKGDPSVSMLKVADDITIGEIGPRVSAFRGTGAGYGVLDGSGRGQIGADLFLQGKKVFLGVLLKGERHYHMVFEMSSRSKGTLMQCILGMDRRLADLERRPPGPQ
ncbi:hypothetical protein Tco_0707074 [Tanacetum coccineum]|uniref:Uncharacterized protein n=1 Tax=Tanacetum coccineum TaxID=301880 RepID=A0ABQ4Y963_9ASTR